MSANENRINIELREYTRAMSDGSSSSISRKENVLRTEEDQEPVEARRDVQEALNEERD